MIPPAFVPGLELSRRFYHEAVRPLLDAHYPGLPHAAALLGSGSEVLGFDDETSTDHHWGPRLLLFLPSDLQARLGAAIWKMLAGSLPVRFLGYPTHFTPPDPEDSGTQHLQAVDRGPINHRVEIMTVAGFFADALGFDVTRPLEPADWLTFPTQALRSITAGAVYHDDLGLGDQRDRFAFYPHDVWLYLLACGWERIGQEEHLMGRAGSAGDEIGAALIGARLVRDIMRLAFLMERVYAPYPKWFGAAFRQLASAAALTPSLQSALAATDWQAREVHLVRAYESLAHQHNALGVTAPLPEQTRPFFGRPFQVIALHGFAAALLAQIDDPAVRAIAARPPIGSVDLLSDNTDLLSNPLWRPILRHLYEPPDSAGQPEKG